MTDKATRLKNEKFHATLRGEENRSNLVQESDSSSQCSSDEENLIEHNDLPRGVSESPKSASKAKRRLNSPRNNSDVGDYSFTHPEDKLVLECADKKLIYYPREVENHCSMWPAVAGIVCILLVGIVVGCWNNSNNSSANIVKQAPINCSSLTKLYKGFPEQNTIFWKAVKYSAQAVLHGNPPQPTVLVFVHSGDEVKAATLIRQLSFAIHSCLESESPPLILTERDFNKPEMLEDYGVAITTYKDLLRKSVVMFVHGIQNISAKVVEAFHSMCDRYNPLVDKSIILFTLEVPESKLNDASGKLDDAVENMLADQWKGVVPKNKIQALLARMTETVVILKTE